MDLPESLAAGLAKAKVPTAQAHLFLCLGPECAPMEQGTVAWEYLKRRVAELGLEVMRTKANACGSAREVRG